MFKNQTPQQLSFFIAGISAAAIAVLLLLMKATGLLAVTWPEVLGLFILAFGVAFLTNYYLVRYFIFRRIKLIYKIIHRQKLPADFKAGITVIFVKLPAPIIPIIPFDGLMEKFFTATVSLRLML